MVTRAQNARGRQTEENANHVESGRKVQDVENDDLGGQHDLDQERYTSQVAPLKGHERAVAFAKDQGN